MLQPLWLASVRKTPPPHPCAPRPCAPLPLIFPPTVDYSSTSCLSKLHDGKKHYEQYRCLPFICNLKKKKPFRLLLTWDFCLSGCSSSFKNSFKAVIYGEILGLNKCLSHSRISFSYLCPASWYFTVPTVSPFLRQRVAFLGLFFIPCVLLLLLIMDLRHWATSLPRDRQYER